MSNMKAIYEREAYRRVSEFISGRIKLLNCRKGKMSTCAKSSCVQLFATPWTVAHQAPLSMGCSRQEHWSGLPCPPPGDLLDPGIKPAVPAAPTLQVNSLLLSHQGKPKRKILYS